MAQPPDAPQTEPVPAAGPLARLRAHCQTVAAAGTAGGGEANRGGGADFPPYRHPQFHSVPIHPVFLPVADASQVSHIVPMMRPGGTNVTFPETGPSLELVPPPPPAADGKPASPSAGRPQPPHVTVAEPPAPAAVGWRSTIFPPDEPQVLPNLADLPRPISEARHGNYAR